ncbi:MAG: acetylglucosamine-6-sulfatase [Blastopirellula sp.]|nr:MAG: acetylglucosamine-6-sulfatase [Blastopirellula sp.]
MNYLSNHLRPLVLAFFLLTAASAFAEDKRPNIIFILSDDHRFDFMSFMPQSPDFLETPNLDRMANEGAHLKNAFVSTSLCSPSRASILTGQYMHHHKVVDNQRPVQEGTIFYPQYLQQAGYHTGFIGKWHMGHGHDEARPGFDDWMSFKGQGSYFDPVMNINGTTKEFKGRYNADVLTDLSIDWLKERKQSDEPFFLHLAYKAVHYPFQPAKRNKGKYRGNKIDYPETMANTERNYRTQPNWVRQRRYSIHGIDHMETGPFDKDPVPDLDELFYDYCETVHGLDENIGRIMDHLTESKMAEDTIVFYMGDNGFHLGEHGFYDKRDAFETSIRVPLLVWAPGRVQGGLEISQMIQNFDIASTVLELAGVEIPQAAKFDGDSFAPFLFGKEKPWRDHILYEYQWEWNFPATPSLFAIRTDRYKYVYFQGVWDIDAFYDLETDPIERHNLIDIPAYQEKIKELREQMFREFAESDGLNLPVRIPAGDRLDQRKLSR